MPEEVSSIAFLIKMRILRFRKVNYLTQSQNGPCRVCRRWIWTQLSDSEARALNQHAALGGVLRLEGEKSCNLVVVEGETRACREGHDQQPREGAELDVSCGVDIWARLSGNSVEAAKSLPVGELEHLQRTGAWFCSGTARSSVWVENIGMSLERYTGAKLWSVSNAIPGNMGFILQNGGPSFIIPNDLSDNNIWLRTTPSHSCSFSSSLV